MTEPTRSQPIPLTQLKHMLPQLQTALQAFDRGTRIFRGLSYSDAPYLHKPQMQFGQRTSANTENYYTLVVDHDDAWSDYPPRSSSIIASNRLHVARGYGMTYVVLPEHDPQIGICSKADYWISFPRVTALTGHADLSELNTLIRRMAHTYAATNRFVPPDYRYFTQVLEIIDEQLAAQNTDWSQLLDSSDWKQQEVAQFMSRTPNLPILERLQWLLNPDANGFSHAHLSVLQPLEDSHEIWMHAPIYMIAVDQLPPDWLDNRKFNLEEWILQQ